jgi:hypothetical protein
LQTDSLLGAEHRNEWNFIPDSNYFHSGHWPRSIMNFFELAHTTRST